MSLQVWLPLNENLNNQGLSNVKVTNNNATINNSGKIGKCYAFNGTNANLQFTPNVDGLKEISIAFWIYNESSSGAIFSLERGYYWQLTILNSTICIRDNSIGYNGRLKYFNFSQIPLNKWTHFTLTYKSGELKVYINGELDSTSSVGGTALNSAINNARIGSSVKSGYYSTCKINDFRIYDHALSPKEVKEISKGLVLHYTMSENVQQLNNCFNYPTFNTSSASGGWSHWAPSGSTGSYSQNTDKTYIYNKSQTYSHKVSHLTGSYYMCHKSPAFEGGFRSVQAIIKLEDGSHPKGKVSFSHKANVLNKPTEYIELGDGFYLMRKQGFKQDGSNDLVSIIVSHNAVVYISEAYLENDREACSDILNLRSTVVHDTSGYLHDGTITGNLSVSNDSPRYGLSTFISDGLTNYIKTPTINIAGDAITVSIWIKSTNTTPTGSYHMPFESSSVGYVEMSIHSSGYLRAGLYINGSRKIDNTSGVNVLDGNWHMISMTYDGANIKRYIDGVVLSTTAVTGILSATSQEYYFGKYGTNNSYAAKDMYLSDARLYSTALSADDIKELYDTAALIDNGHNLHCYEFVEDDVTSPMIEKNGLVKTNEFNEYPDDYIFYDYIQSSGTQYIDTEIFLSNKDKFEIKFQRLSTTSTFVSIFGAIGGGTTYTSTSNFSLTYISNKYGIYCDGAAGNTNYAWQGGNITNQKIYTIRYNGLNVNPTINGSAMTQTTTHTLTQNNPTKTTWLFGRNNTGSGNISNSQLKVFYLKMWNNGLIVRYLIPAKRKSDNEIGMYDMVTGRFFGNSGTGAFTAGTPIDVAAMYEQKIDLNQLLEI